MKLKVVGAKKNYSLGFYRHSVPVYIKLHKVYIKLQQYRALVLGENALKSLKGFFFIGK